MTEAIIELKIKMLILTMI